MWSSGSLWLPAAEGWPEIVTPNLSKNHVVRMIMETRAMLNRGQLVGGCAIIGTNLRGKGEPETVGNGVGEDFSQIPTIRSH